MIKQQAVRGFTLIELLIAIAIVAILAGVALPLYTDYIDTSRQGVLVTNISTIEVFQEDFRLRTGNYLTNAANTAAITAAIGWDPQEPGITYSIAPGAGGGYEVTATDAGGVTVCMAFPVGTRC